MATHCSILAWEIPWTEEPGRLQSTGSQTVRHDWATNTHTPLMGEKLHESLFKWHIIIPQEHQFIYMNSVQSVSGHLNRNITSLYNAKINSKGTFIKWWN